MPDAEAAPALLVTGASTGIGRAVALAAARAGWRVFGGVRREEDGAALEADAGGALRALILDVTEESQRERAADDIEEERGEAGLQGLVNNAGIVVSGPLEFLPLEEFRLQMEVNVTGLLAVTQRVLPLLRLAGGRIVNVGSISGRVGFPLEGAYNASKFALEGLSDVLRLELVPWGLHVALIEPGSVATPLWGRMRQQFDRAVAAMPEAAQRFYGSAFRRWREEVDDCERRGISPEAVVRPVLHALTARRPRARYLVGKSARRLALAARFLPDRLRDRLILARLKFGEPG